MTAFVVTKLNVSPGALPKKEIVLADGFIVMDGDLIFSNTREGDGSYENVCAYAKGRWLEIEIE